MIQIDMDMPRNCRECPAMHELNGSDICTVPVKKIEDSYAKGRPEWCPLIEVKTVTAKIVTNGNCCVCGKPLDSGLFLCKKCAALHIRRPIMSDPIDRQAVIDAADEII